MLILTSMRFSLRSTRPGKASTLLPKTGPTSRACACSLPSRIQTLPVPSIANRSAEWFASMTWARGGAASPSKSSCPSTSAAKRRNAELCTVDAAFRQKHVEVRGHRFRIELSHHQRDLTSVVSGMVREMLHQVPQAHFLFAKGKRFCQGLFGQAIHELGLLSFDFCPFQPNRSDARKCVRMEKVVAPRPQIRQESSGMRRLPPVGKPAPLAAQDMHERVSYGAKAAA